MLPLLFIVFCLSLLPMTCFLTVLQIYIIMGNIKKAVLVKSSQLLLCTAMTQCMKQIVHVRKGTQLRACMALHIQRPTCDPQACIPVYGQSQHCMTDPHVFGHHRVATSMST